MKIKTALIFILSVSFFLTSCEEEDVIIDPGYDYFPVELGRYVDYRVDSVYHDLPAGVQDTFQFYVREFIDSTFFDAESRPTNRIQRLYKDDLSADWVLKDIWVANRVSTSAQKVEENVRFVKLVFPVEPDVTWDGNAQNINEEWQYEYSDLFIPKTIGDSTYTQTITVIQRDRENLLEREYAKEVYGLGVGMVYKQLDTLKFSLENGVSELETGVELKMTAIAHGVIE
ncbi:MAG: hypothetical protein HKN45_08845 [Flavobacteriales bacterium]|nr:hypothetical protein [Flavobacteriales bacterium]